MAHRSHAATTILTMLLAIAAPAVSARTIEWSGFTWTVRNSPQPSGPGGNIFSDSTDSVFVDAEGNLRLRIRQREDGKWVSSEIVSTHSPTYGLFEWEVASRYDEYAENVVAGLFTYLDPLRVAQQTGGRVGNGRADTPHEIDIELTQAFTRGSANLHYVTHDPDVAPVGKDFYQPLADAATTHRFVWEPDRIAWSSYAGHVAGVAEPPQPLVEQRPGRNFGRVAASEYSGQVIPTDLDERVHLNFWLFGGEGPTRGPANGQPHELVVKSFTYTPLPQGGDFNADGAVDGRDLLQWQRGAASSAWNGEDLGRWEAEFGQAALAPLAVPLPEPTGMASTMWAAALAAANGARMRTR